MKIKSELEKQKRIKQSTIKYGEFLTSLGFDWENDSNMKGTPLRVSRMMYEEIFRGMYDEVPKMTVFDNVDEYDGLVFQGNIEVKSMCSHHILPFFGKAHVAYIPSKTGKIIGLSKLNRIVNYFSRRPQVQENLTMQIHDFIANTIGYNLGVAVMIEATHTCVSHRGIKQASTMKTTKLSGYFLADINKSRDEFYNYIEDLKK